MTDLTIERIENKKVTLSWKTPIDEDLEKILFSSDIVRPKKGRLTMNGGPQLNLKLYPKAWAETADTLDRAHRVPKKL